jgi:hypothetical protein
LPNIEPPTSYEVGGHEETMALFADLRRRGAIPVMLESNGNAGWIIKVKWPDE